jgi:hypothetical protein
MEVWKEFGTNGKYLISNYGRVKSIFKYSAFREDRKSGIREIIRKPMKDKDGYMFYCLDINGKGKKTLRIHKEVFRYFVSDNFSNKDQICHLNGDRTNNYVYNLYKGNQRTNTLDKYKHGTTKISINQVLEIRKIGKSKSQYDIALMFGIKQPYVSRILSNKRCIYI